MTLKDWATLLLALLGTVGWFMSWWNRHTMRVEMRGVKGFKFRLMYRTLAKQHGWPINGEDKD